MNLEEWIMQNLTWIDLSVAGLTLIAAVMSIFVLVKSEKTTRLLMDEKHKGRASEHQNLSEKIDSKTANLSQSIMDKHHFLETSQGRIEQAVSYLKEQQIRADERRQGLSRKELDIVKTGEHLSSLIDIMKEQSICIQKLEQENKELKRQLKHYQECEEEQEF